MRDGHLDIRPERMSGSSDGVRAPQKAKGMRDAERQESRQETTLARSPAGRQTANKTAHRYDKPTFWQTNSLMRLYHRDPSWSLLMAGAAALSFGVIINALYLQRHAPMSMAMPATLSSTWGAAGPGVRAEAPVPQPSPLVANAPAKNAQARSKEVITRDIQLELTRRGFFEEPADGVWGPATETALLEFAQTAGMDGQLGPTEDWLREIRQSQITVKDQVAKILAVKAAPASKEPQRDASANTEAKQEQRNAQVQRALIKAGFGPLSTDGRIGAQTRQAILQFERSRGLPQTGEMTPRVLRELSLVSGIKIDQ